MREAKEKILDYFLNLNIDLNKEQFINIDNICIPNYLLYPINNDNNIDLEYLSFEFCKQLKKIFGEYFFTKLSCYENSNINIMQKDIVFDCGGNFGIFSAYAASKAKKVVVFEPMSLIFPYLKKTCSNYSNIILEKIGVGAINGQAIFNQCDNPAASHKQDIANNYFENIHNVIYQENCNIVTLDNYIQQTGIYPTFIKADIEGSELEMLQGLQWYLKEYSPKLAIVPHGKINFQLILRYLKENYNNIYHFELKNIDGIIIILGDKKC